MNYELISESAYISDKNVFLIRIDMSAYLIDYFLKRKEIGQNTSTEQEEKLRDLIACFAIHLTARTAFETHAWTLTLISEKPYSLFVTGSTGELSDDGIARGFLLGNIMTDNIRHPDSNSIHAQFISHGKVSNSYAPCESDVIPEMAETFYSRSEQLPLRIRLSDNDDTALGIVALPGFDVDWFNKVDLLDFANSGIGEKSKMRNCRFTFNCDCSPEKLLPFFKTLDEASINELYGDDKEIMITCPRCGRRFRIDRELMFN
jgi:molecular chaperone Hsp33